MLRKRVIFTLIYNDGNFIQSRNFRHQKVGNIKWLENNYKFQKISYSLDELIIINASKENKNTQDFSNCVSKLVEKVFIPVCAGGGITSMKDAEVLFNKGADKIILNTALYSNPELVKSLSLKYGAQSIIASIDYKKINNKYCVYINNGEDNIELPLDEYINHINKLNVGEIYLNSIDKDGTGFGYDLSPLSFIQNKITTPLIIAGGAGNSSHLIEGLSHESVSAVATANLFNFVGDGLPKARREMIALGVNLAKWEEYSKE